LLVGKRVEQSVLKMVATSAVLRDGTTVVMKDEQLAESKADLLVWKMVGKLAVLRAERTVVLKDEWLVESTVVV
jgi:hypothetical protein